jgi:hypothetical protein
MSRVPDAFLGSTLLASALLCAAPLVTSTAALAAERDRWTLGGSAELEQDGGWALGGDLAYRTAGGTRLRAAVARSELKSDNLDALTTTRVSGGVRHRFADTGPAVSLDLTWWQDPDTVTARELAAAAEFGPPELTLGVSARLRRSEFEPFAVRGTVQLPNGRTILLSGTADCELDDLGYGLDLIRDTGAWSFSLSGRKYDYDDTECSFSSRSLDALSRARSGVFRQFAAAQAQRLSRIAASQSDEQTSFLDYQAGGGVAWRRDADQFGLDASHSREEFDGLESNALTLHWTRVLDDGVDVVVYGGATDSDAWGTLPFVGVAVSRTF